EARRAPPGRPARGSPRRDRARALHLEASDPARARARPRAPPTLRLAEGALRAPSLVHDAPRARAVDRATARTDAGHRRAPRRPPAAARLAVTAQGTGSCAGVADAVVVPVGLVGVRARLYVLAAERGRAVVVHGGPGVPPAVAVGIELGVAGPGVVELAPPA